MDAEFLGGLFSNPRAVDAIAPHHKHDVHIKISDSSNNEYVSESYRHPKTEDKGPRPKSMSEKLG